MSGIELAMTSHVELDEEREMGLITGGLERELGTLEEVLGVKVSLRGARLIIQGPEAPSARAMEIVEELRALNSMGKCPRGEQLHYALRAVARGRSDNIASFLDTNVAVSPRKKAVIPRTSNQIRYINAIRAGDMVFGIGPAGTGKTYLAMAMAINALLNKQVSRVVLARPAVEAGERLGFLPGDLQDKVNPYLRPLYDALFNMMEFETANRMIEKGVIEIAPLAFMRGRTLDDAFIILDEAQNTTAEQMKMYLTRLGNNSKTVITGDVTQIDLPKGSESGLVQAGRILTGIEGISFVYFSQKDVVRHKLVQMIVEAYERHDKERLDDTKDTNRKPIHPDR